MIFDGCSHSFHLKCLSDDINFCPLCQQFLREKAKQLAQTAINAILHGNPDESVNRLASSDDKDKIKNDDQEESDNDTINNDNFEELILNSLLTVVSWHYHQPHYRHPFHYLFHSNLETSKNNPDSKAILQLSTMQLLSKSLIVKSADIQEKVINSQRMGMFNVLIVKMAFVEAMFVQGKHKQHHIH